ncbi:glycosyltransferase family 2 protein [Cyclobacterium plantarum]|uniref:glycosyltransferase family 2 protein n=1 Tax=Cyclobacterium plantarum TaxID=2716263 RepID=UPI003F72DE5D
MNNLLISVVIPCYNEAENIPLLLSSIFMTLKTYNYEIILVNDGSNDETQTEIESASKKSPYIKYINFSRNFGHQAALKAGIDHAKGDCVITIDADLQKPPETMLEMITLWTEGHDIVTAVCKNEGQPSLIKKMTSTAYYWLLSKLADHQVIPNGADFRLIDRRIVDIIRNMNGQNLYLRGLCAWSGYRQATTFYREENRKIGNTKYSFKNMLNLASNGITSFSIKPLRFALSGGLFFAIMAFFYGIYALLMVWAGSTVPGWASIVASIVFLSGIQLIVLGVIGEYIGKLYREVSQRPAYLISKTNISISPGKNESDFFPEIPERGSAMV